MIYLGEGQPHRLYKSTVKESLAIIQSLRKYKGNEENNLPLSYMWDIINSGFQEPHPSTTAVDFFMPLFTEACFCIPTRRCCCLPLSRPGWLHSPLFAQVTPALSVVAAPRPKSRTAHGLLAGCRQVRSHKLAAPMGSVGLLVYLWGEIWNSCSKHNYFTDCHVAVRVPRCCLDSQTQYIRHSR